MLSQLEKSALRRMADDPDDHDLGLEVSWERRVYCRAPSTPNPNPAKDAP